MIVVIAAAFAAWWLRSDSHALSSAAWREHFGERTYHCFVYKNCLFLVLNTMDGRKDFKVKEEGRHHVQGVGAVRTVPTGTK